MGCRRAVNVTIGIKNDMGNQKKCGAVMTVELREHGDGIWTASGARIILTLLHEMQKRPEVKRGLATLCIGGGMGVATIFEKC